MWSADTGSLELSLFDEDSDVVAQEVTSNVLPGEDVIIEQVSTGQQDGDVMIATDNVVVRDEVLTTAELGDNAWETADSGDDDVIVGVTFDDTVYGPEVIVSDGNGGTTTTGGTISPQGG